MDVCMYVCIRVHARVCMCYVIQRYRRVLVQCSELHSFFCFFCLVSFVLVLSSGMMMFSVVLSLCLLFCLLSCVFFCFYVGVMLSLCRCVCCCVYCCVFCCVLLCYFILFCCFHVTFPNANNAVSKNNNIPRIKKSVPKPVKPTPISNNENEKKKT
jgi:predicted membrane protein